MDTGAWSHYLVVRMAANLTPVLAAVQQGHSLLKVGSALHARVVLCDPDGCVERV